MIDREEFASFYDKGIRRIITMECCGMLHRRDLVNRFGSGWMRRSAGVRISCSIWSSVRYAETFYALRTPVYYYVKTKGSAGEPEDQHHEDCEDEAYDV